MNDYGEIFAARASQYHFAMQAYPRARDAEFLAIVQDLPAGAIDLLDVPSGGGYLSSYLSSPSTLRSCDFSVGFAGAGVPKASPQSLPYDAASFDAVLSLTGLHHIARANQDAFLAECHRVLRGSGSVLVGEVLRGSPVDAFLNDFVHRHNSQGHAGNFCDEGFLAQLAAAGFGGARMQVRSYAWRFADVPSMVTYCRNMFGIDRADDALIEDGLRDHLGFRVAQDGTVELPWQLVFYRAVKP
jgi:SAM-dependent methyltransferase